VRAIDLKGMDLGDVTQVCENMPIVIRNVDELYDAIGDEGIAGAIEGQIDFTREMLLYFRWEGSGEDRIRVTPARTSSGREVNFVFRPGMTLDLRPHHGLFAVENDVRWTFYGVLGGNE